MENTMINYSDPFQIICPACGEIFEADDDCIMSGGETPSTESVWIECPYCGYEQDL